MKNKVTFTFIFTLLVVAGLVAMYWLPEPESGKIKLRKVDLLADIRPDPVEPADTDSICLPPVVKPVFVDTCKTGMVCIEDYADSSAMGMKGFYEALGQVETLGRPVRIAYFGDSFIEGDILTADLRALFQRRFGGRGVGYVPVTSMIAGFRPTVKHTFGGWDSHAITDSVDFDRSRQDISNHYFVPRTGAWVSLTGQRNYAACLDSCRTSSFYFLTSDSLVLSSRVNGGEPRYHVFGGDSTLQVASVEGSIGSVSWKVERMDSTVTCYAATMDDEEGVTVDNFSTRGSSGQQLGSIPTHLLRAYNRYRTYDLIVLQYGLNVASEGVRNYAYYTDPMKRVVERLKKAFPQAAILIVGIGDRENKDENGELRTMSAVKYLARYQQALAAETQVAFWNLFEAMGGEGSMAELVNSKPSMANYDYTHINFRGGKRLAEILFDALMYGKEQYERRKAYETE